jgi:acyl dehydratase
MVPDELKQYIGKVDPPHLREVEKGAIRRYADAVGDDNPLYCDDEYAKNTKYGGIISPPGFFGWAKRPISSSEGLIGVIEAMIGAGYAGILDGGMAYDFYLPVRVGDTLVGSPKVSDIALKEGKTKMMIVRFETSYFNQNGDLVAKSYQTLIGRQL